MKRLLIGLFAAGVALSISAFTTIKPKSGFMMYYYVLTNGAFYQRITYTPNGVDCAGTASNKCFLGYTTYQGESFPASSIPGPIAVQSAGNGLYMP